MAKNEYKCDCNSIHDDVVKKAKNVINEIHIFDDLEIFYKAFADSTRLKIMSILDNIGDMCVCDIAVSLNMTKSAISHQLTYLRKNNLVKAFKSGKEVMYSIADKHVKDVFEKGVEHVMEDYN